MRNNVGESRPHSVECSERRCAQLIGENLPGKRCSTTHVIVSRAAKWPFLLIPAKFEERRRARAISIRE